MKGRKLLITATLSLVIAIIFFVINSSYKNVEVGASVLLPDGSETQESMYQSEELLHTIQVDSYAVRFGDVNFYEDLNQVSFIMFSSKGTDEETYTIRIYDMLTQDEFQIIRTGMKSKLYHSYENLYTYVEPSYQGTLIVEVTKGVKVMERISFRVY